MHVRCPHCHNPIEVVDDASLSDILCPLCGSGFSLVGDLETTEDFAATHGTIGHFRLTQPLGMGAFGVVWKATETQLDRRRHHSTYVTSLNGVGVRASSEFVRRGL